MLEFETAWGMFHSRAHIVGGDPIKKRYHVKFENTPETADRTCSSAVSKLYVPNWYEAFINTR